jgi:hypothetical protein
VTENSQRQPAVEPEDLDRMFLERANAGDVDCVVALCEPNAVLAFPRGQLAAGPEQIRTAYVSLLATRPSARGVDRRDALPQLDLEATEVIGRDPLGYDHRPRLGDELMHLVLVQCVQPGADPVVTHVRSDRQKELLRLCRNE